MARKKKGNAEKVFCIRSTSNSGEELYLKFADNKNSYSHYIRADTLNTEFLDHVKIQTMQQMDQLYGEGNYKVELLVYSFPKVEEVLL